MGKKRAIEEVLVHEEAYEVLLDEKVKEAACSLKATREATKKREDRSWERFAEGDDSPF